MLAENVPLPTPPPALTGGRKKRRRRRGSIGGHSPKRGIDQKAGLSGSKGGRPVQGLEVEVKGTASGVKGRMVGGQGWWLRFKAGRLGSRAGS